MTYTVTANQLRAHDPCPDGLALLETVSAELGLGPDQPVDFNTVLDRGGLKYAAWAARAAWVACKFAALGSAKHTLAASMARRGRRSSGY